MSEQDLVNEATEAHKAAVRSYQLAEEYQAHRNELAEQLHRSDPEKWTHEVLARAMGLPYHVSDHRLMIPCVQCGEYREIYRRNYTSTANRMCRVCAGAQRVVNNPVKRESKPRVRKATPRKTRSYVLAAEKEDTAVRFIVEDPIYCGEELSSGGYCKRHFPCQHHLSDTPE